MTQVEIRAKAAEEYCMRNIPNLPDMHLAISTAFEAGAEWEEDSRWINIEDRMPENVVFVHKGNRFNSFMTYTEEVLVCTADGKVSTDYRFRENGVWRWEWNDSTKAEKIEYWMPIPAPKKKGGKNGLE